MRVSRAAGEAPRAAQKPRPAWNGDLKDASIYRLPRAEMLRRRSLLASKHNVFTNPPPGAGGGPRRKVRVGGRWGFAEGALTGATTLRTLAPGAPCVNKCRPARTLHARLGAHTPQQAKRPACRP
jgi:hypothetical protein